MDLTKQFEGETFGKSSFSGVQNDCVYLPQEGDANRVADSKSGQVLSVSRNQLLALAAIAQAS